MPSKTVRLTKLGEKVMRALHRAGVRPSVELAEVQLIQAAVEFESEGKEAFLARAAIAFDQVVDAGAVDVTNPREVAKADQALAELIGPHTPREALEDITRMMGDQLKKMVPEGLGWAAFAFNFGKGGFTAYASNACRGDMVKMLGEFIGTHHRRN